MTMDAGPEYGSIRTDTDDSARVASFRRVGVLLLAVCGMVAGAGLFSLGKHASVSTAHTAVTSDAAGAATAPTTPTQDPNAEKGCAAGLELVDASKPADEANCVACAAGKFKATDDRVACDDWTECVGGEDTVPDQGVGTPGTPQSDVVCEDCAPGKASFETDSSSECFTLTDSDGDSLWDRLPPSWVVGAAFDTRTAPSSGGEYDRCPFDKLNDADDDGICDGEAPPLHWHAHLEAGRDLGVYPKGAWHVDECPNDPDNNKDKDRFCDDVDSQMISWNFYSDNLNGWVNSQDAFAIASPEKLSDSIDVTRFIFDRRVVEVCSIDDQFVEAMFQITQGRFDWTDTDDEVMALMEIRAAMVEARENEPDEAYRAEQEEEIEMFDSRVKDVRDKLRYKAREARFQQHHKEATVERQGQKKRTLEARLALAEEGSEDETDLKAQIADIDAEVAAVQEELNGLVADLPTEVAQLKMRKFVRPTCQALCKDHNMKCMSGRVVDEFDVDRGNLREIKRTEIADYQAQLKEMNDRMEFLDMAYVQASLKKLPRADELKQDMHDLQKKMEETRGLKKGVENELSACSPFNQDKHEERQEERKKSIGEQLGQLSTQKESNKEALTQMRKDQVNAEDNATKRDLAHQISELSNEQAEINAKMDELEIKVTGCLDDAGDSSENLQCMCGHPDEAEVEEEWSGDTTCPTCFAQGEQSGKLGALFTIKKNTIRLGVKSETSANNFVKLSILAKDTVANQKGGVNKAALDGAEATYQELLNTQVSDGDQHAADDWYPVEWDLTEHIGKKAYLEASHFDAGAPLGIDEVEFFTDSAGCLPTCMAVRDGACNGGKETCFYFEEDKTPYVLVKANGHGKGTYCRAGGNMGSPLGPGIGSMGYDYADWTDNDSEVAYMLGERDNMVMSQEQEKTAWIKKEKGKDDEDLSRKNADEMDEHLAKIDIEWETKIDKYDEKIYAARKVARDAARDLRLSIAKKQRQVAKLQVDRAAAKVAGEDDSSIQSEIKSQHESIREDMDALKAKVGDDAGWISATTEHLQALNLPRCLYIDLRGSHMGISLDEPDATLYAFNPEPSLDNASVDGTHCVYHSVKPQCVAMSKASNLFYKVMRASCKEQIFEGTCLNHCEKMYCSAAYDKDGNGHLDRGDVDACGQDDNEGENSAFDKCAVCCNRLSDKTKFSSCFSSSRRRRLRDAVAEAPALRAFNKESKGDYSYSRNECAMACLSTPGCIGFDTRKGVCMFTEECNTQGAQKGAAGYRTGKWYIHSQTTRQEVGMSGKGTFGNTRSKRKVKNGGKKNGGGTGEWRPEDPSEIYADDAAEEPAEEATEEATE